MLSIIYEGAGDYKLTFDSKKEITLTSQELEYLMDQIPNALYGEETHGTLLQEQREEQPLHQDGTDKQ